MATASGTRSFVQRARSSLRLLPDHVRSVRVAGRVTPPTTAAEEDHDEQLLSTTSLGFGTYKLDGSKESWEGLRRSLRSGFVNLVESSTHYGQYPGQSEEMVGAAVAERLAAAGGEEGVRSREEVILVTKIGHLAVPPGESVSAAKKLWPTATGGGVEEDIAVGTHGGPSTLHCLDPRFLVEETLQSCVRLRTQPDIVLLHNPEFWLADARSRGIPLADAWDEFYSHHLENAFAALEALTRAGQIGGYGVSGNFLSCSWSVSGRRPNGYEGLCVQRLLRCCAEAVARAPKNDSDSTKNGKKIFGGLTILQAPLNPLEGGFLLGRDAPSGFLEPDLDVAERQGLSVLFNRPLLGLPPKGMGVRSHEWAHAEDDAHARFSGHQKPLQQLFRKVMAEEMEAAGTIDEGLSLASLTLLLSSSASNKARAITLNGMRRERYVEEAVKVLQTPLVKGEVVKRVYTRFRALATELGGDVKGLW